MKTPWNPTEQNEVRGDAAWTLAHPAPVSHKAYHEMSDVPVVEKDALTQLEDNLEVLSDLQKRLSFVMREVRFMMKA